MESFALRMLGTFSVTVGEQQVTDFAADKVRALLSYLAVESARPHLRATLAAFLWPELASENAFDNLRKSLYRLRHALDGASPGLSEVIAVTRQSVQFVGPRECVDVLTFQDLLAEVQAHAHPDLQSCDSCLARLAQAVELYQGELLAGFAVSEAPDFEEWLLLQRESLHHQALLTLLALSTAWEARGDLARANFFTGRILILDPYREEAYRQKMRLLALLGMSKQALEQYEICRRLLEEELGVQPDKATTALFQQIASGSYPGKAALPETGQSEATEVAAIIASGVTPGGISGRNAGPDLWSDVPETGQLYGRRQEIAHLTHWLTVDRCRLVAILGMGGMGKTTLAAAVVRAVAGHFDAVLWRSLVNAPPLDEVLREWLEMLAAQPVSALPESLDARFTLLLDHLRNRRCLVVLDNLESIFQPDQAGQLRPDYQEYTQLLKRLGEVTHKSCLLLTSRERPHMLARMEEDLPWVRSLQLDGLDLEAAQEMLSQRGVAGERHAQEFLVGRYSGNPLALKLVAETIQELFDGDIAPFLASEAVIFDDIRTVLAWQFDRLPPLEQEILIWIAVEREPVSLQMLRDDLSPPPMAADLVAAVRSLQRRSLLDRATTSQAGLRPGQAAGVDAAGGFVLQNVLMEFLIDRLIDAACQEIEQEQLVRLYRHALMKTYSMEYVRQSQVRLILQPIVDRLRARLGTEGAIQKMARLIDALRAEPRSPGGYAAGNLLNLLLLLDVDLTGYDFSHLQVWQADLRNAILPAANFGGADLRHTTFAYGFRFVFAVACSPDGQMIAAGTSNGDVRLWRASDGQLLYTFLGHKGTVRSLAFSPDSALLASGGEDETVRLWQISSGQNQDGKEAAHVLHGHTGRVTTVAFHPNGKMLASGSVDRTVRLWEIGSSETKAVLQGHEHWVWALAFHPDGARLATASFDLLILLWDIESASVRTFMGGHAGLVSSLAFDPTGAYLASGSYDQTVRIWDVESGEVRHILKASQDEINSIAISPDGELLASGGDDGVARLWDLRSGTIRHQLHGHKGEIMSLAITPDGRTLVTGSEDQTVRLWDLSAGRIRRVISGHSQGVPLITFHPHSALLVSCHYDSVVRLWDLERRAIEQTLHGHRHVVRTVAISRDGAWLASGGDDQIIQIWALSEAPSAERTNTHLIHARRQHILHGHQGRVSSVAFSPDGAILASAGSDHLVYLWDVQSGKLLHILRGHELPISALQFTLDGTLLVSAGADQTIRLWDPHSAKLRHMWRSHTDTIYTVAFTPDGEKLVTSGGESEIHVWDIRSPLNPRLLKSLRGYGDRVISIAMSPDGSFLVGGGADYAVRVWDMHTYQLIHTLRGHTNWVWSVSVSPDGETIASSSPDGIIRLWARQSGECLVELSAPGPYAGMNIGGVTGLAEEEKSALKALGAVEK